MQIADLEAQLIHVQQASNSSNESTPKGAVGSHATLPQTGLAPPASDSFKAWLFALRVDKSFVPGPGKETNAMLTLPSHPTDTRWISGDTKYRVFLIVKSQSLVTVSQEVSML